MVESSSDVRGGDAWGTGLTRRAVGTKADTQAPEAMATKGAVTRSAEARADGALHGLLQSRWVVPAAGSVVHGLHASCVYIGPATLLSPMRMELGLTVSEIALPLNVFRVINALFLVPVGIFLDRHGAEKPLRISIITAALLCFLLPLCNKLYQLVILQAAFATTKLFGGLTSMLMMVSMYFSKDSMGTATSVLLGGYSAAGFVAPLVVGFFGQNYGWRVASLILDVLFLAIGVPLALTFLRADRTISGYEPVAPGPDDVAVQKTPEDAKTTAEDSDGTMSTSKSTATTEGTQYPLLPAPYLAILGIVASFTISMHVVLDHLVMFLREEVGYSLERSSVYMSTLNLVALFTKIAAGVLGDKLNKGLLMMGFGVLELVGTSLLFDFSTVFTGALALTRDPRQIGAFVLLQAAGYAGVFNLTTAVLPEFGTQNLGVRSNLNLVMLFGVGSLGSYAAGVIRTATGSYTDVFALSWCACASVIGCSLMYYLLMLRQHSRASAAARRAQEKQ